MAGKLASQVRGLSEAQFREAYGTEEQCRAVVEKLRWPAGLRLPGLRRLRGQVAEHPAEDPVPGLPAPGLAHRRHHLPRHQAAADDVVPGHVADRDRQERDQLGRARAPARDQADQRLGLKQKIMAVMAGREDSKRLDGRVEMDDVYLGGHRPGKRGRGAAGKQPFVAAVSTTDDRRPRKIKLLPVKGFRKKEIRKLVAEHLASTSRLVTDGLRCWTAATEAGLEHTAIVTGSGKRAAGWSPFKWVNTTLGNVKAAITGTYRYVSPDHAGRYLASFAWRFNRRFQLASLIPRLVHSAVRTAPLPYRQLVAS